MYDADKYYELTTEDVYPARKIVIDTLKLAPDGYTLTMEDINALGRMLAYGHAGGDYTGFREAVVYLWMSYRIQAGALHLLLEMVSDDGDQ